MSFQSPLWLLALAIVPIALLALWLRRRRTIRYAIRFPALATLREAVAASPSWERHLPAALALAAAVLLVLALARPHVSYSKAVQHGDVMLVTDHSGSMAATDVAPSRLVAATAAADRFIGRLPSTVSLGAVAFSTHPDAVQAPVLDHAAARAVIDAQVADGGTDTGDALKLALQLLHGGSRGHPPSAIVLLSDGAANLGPSPVAVARQAGRDHIPIYTVALGTYGGILPSPLPFGPPQPVPPDPQLMRQIAQVSGGRAFNARSAGELSAIYQHLGTKLGSVRGRHEITFAFAIAGLIALGGAAAVSARRWARVPA